MPLFICNGYTLKVMLPEPSNLGPVNTKSYSYIEMARQEFTEQVIKLIRSIPKGCVSTYGDIAWMAGNPQAARQVARILHTCSRVEKLPWYRVVNREGRISLKPFQGYEEQKMLLEGEGVEIDGTGKIDLDKYQSLTQPRNG